MPKMPIRARCLHVSLFLLILAALNIDAQELTDYVSLAVDKRVSDYPDEFDLDTPLNSFVTNKYLHAEGRQSLYRSVNTYRNRGIFPDGDAPNVHVDEAAREEILRTHIVEIVTYRDSVAAVITDEYAPMCIIAYMTLENGQWRSAGEDLGSDLDDARARFRRKAPMFLGFVHRIARLTEASTDTASFAAYLEENRQEPKSFLLEVLADHKLVIYGEVHRRKITWDLLQETIDDPAFVKTTGTVFMELSSDKQSALDRFFSADELDAGIILDIFRNEELLGWYDRGEYEFLTELWLLNHQLPAAKRVRVVAVDIPRPYQSFNTRAEMDAFFENAPDRNEQMAAVISETINEKTDRRNSLFVVGLAHAFKASVPALGFAQPQLSAGAQLAAMFSDEDVFTIFPHCPVIDNHGTIHGRIRDGLFDDVFAALGNRPMGFRLKGSPFGLEPFDGCHEISFNPATGKYADNFDGYIFLGPLTEEPGEYLLYDVITPAFVEELKRRAAMVGESVETWFDVTVTSSDAIIAAMKERNANRKRWGQI